jgi:Tfp pilus assembly protein PilX
MKTAFQKKPQRLGTSQEGSALLTAIIFSFVVALVMGSYLQLSSTEYRLSSRSHLFGLSFNLAEGGLDLALDALRDGDRNEWNTGTDSDGNVYWSRQYTGYDLGDNLTGDIRIVILNAESQAPQVYSEGLVNGHLMGAISKQIQVQLSSGFYPFINGFNSKRGVVLSGNNVTFDSYDSSAGSYGIANVNSEITVATTSVESDALNIGNADIYGYVATGGGFPNVGPKGSITEYSAPGVVDNSRITTDYYAEFPNVTAPTLTSPSTSLPTSGTITGGEYLINNWSMGGTNTLYVTGDVTIVATGDMSLTGKASVHLSNTGSLKIYVAGDLDLSGNGILNASQTPSQLLVFGTNTTEGGQTMKISGNGYLAAAVYAPNAVVELKGGGSSGRVYGAVAGYDAQLSGNSHFSYDEFLENYNLGSTDYSVDNWTELSGTSLALKPLDLGNYGL